MIVPFKVLKEKGEDAWDEAEMVTFRTVIHEFDVIKTWHDSGTVIGHADMSTFTMGPNTTIMIAPPPEQESMVKLVLGNIWINAKKMLKDGSMDIEMNQAIAGARGTKFRCIENGYISEVQVYEGIVEIISKTTKEKILLYPGQGVKCSKNGLSQFSLQDLSHETSLVEKGDVYEGISSRSENGKITDQVISKNSFTNVQAAYVDMWHYQTPQLYLFKDTHYERYDLFASMSIGLNKITKGYPGITFETIDAAYVDARNSESPQLYLFSGVRYCRYDIRANKMVGVNTIKNGYPGLPFKTIDAAYVDSRNLGKPKLYLFSGSRYARYDILNDRYKGSNDIAKGYPGVTFKFIDAAYVDVSKPEGPQLYLFSGSNYARYDICTDKIIEINTNSKGKALGNGQKATSDNYEKAGAWH